MTRQEAVRRLKNWGGYIQIINGIEEEIREMRLNIEHNRHLRAVSLDGMPKGSGIHKPTEETAVKNITLLQEDIAAAEDRIRAERERKAEVDGFVESLDRLEQKIIRLRYIKKKTWQYISMNVYLSLRQCYRVHNKILELMCEKLMRRNQPHLDELIESCNRKILLTT